MKKHFLKFLVTQSKFIAICAAGFILFSCGNSQGGMKLGDDEFAVSAVSVSSSNQTTSYPATIKGTQDIEIRPQVSGFIVKLCVDEGATVRKGQALFQIDPTQYQAAFNQAKASVESVKLIWKPLNQLKRIRESCMNKKSSVTLNIKLHKTIC